MRLVGVAIGGSVGIARRTRLDKIASRSTIRAFRNSHDDRNTDARNIEHEEASAHALARWPTQPGGACRIEPGDDSRESERATAKPLAE